MADTFGFRLGVEGEKDFKKALADINQTYKVLGSEMKLVASQFEKNDNSIEALSARNEVLNKQIDLQKGKIETLRDALKNASESFGENDKRTKNWQVQLNNAEAALNDMERELKDNKTQMDKVADSADDMGDEIKNSGKQADDSKGKFEGLKGTLSSVGKALAATVAAIGTAAVATGKKILDMATETAEAGDEIDKQSQKLGISAENYQKLSYAMERSGADVEDFKKGTMNITKELANMQNGVNGAGTMFNQLGISVQNADGSFKSTEEVLLSTIDALSNMQDETQRNALANSVFGKSYQEILPLLNSGSEGIRELMDEAEQYGMVMSDDAVAASAAFEDSLTKLKGTITGVKNELMSELLPGLTSITDGFTELVSGNDEGADMIKDGLENVIDTVKSMIPKAVSLISTIAAAVLEAAPEILETLSTAIIDLLPDFLEFMFEDVLPKLITTIVSISKQLITSLSEQLPTLLPQIATAIVDLLNELFSPENITSMVEVFITLIKNIVAGLKDALPILIQGVFTLITGIVEALPDIIKMIVDALPDLIKMIVSAIVESIPALIEGVIQLIIGLVEALPDIITAIIEALPDIITSIVDALIDCLPQLIEGSITLTIELVKHLPEIILALIEAIPQIISAIVDAFSECIGPLIEVGGNMIAGLWEGIKNAGAWLWEKISGFFSDIWDGIKDFFGIHSPSTKMRDTIGKNLVKGLAEGITDEGKTAINAMNALADDIGSVTFSTSPINFGGMDDIFSDGYDRQLKASVMTNSYSESAIAKSAPTFNTNVSFGNVTVNDGSDVEDIAHRVSDIIVNDVMVQGGAFA